MSILNEPFLGKNPIEVRISNSSIQSFKGCRRRWYFGDYLGLAKKEKQYSGPLALGSRLHAALEMFYKDGIVPEEAYNQIMVVDRAAFEASPFSKDPDEAKKFNTEAELGRIMMEGYYEWLLEDNPDSKIEPEFVEKTVEYQLKEFDPRVVLQGKVDMHARRVEDNSIAILDHKSAVSFDIYYKTAHMSEQLMYYVMLERLSAEDKEQVVDGGIFSLLKKVKRTAAAKPPFFERIDVRFNDETLQSFWTRTLGTVRDIMAVRDALDAGADPNFVAYPSPTSDCTWKCPFFNGCTMMDDGSDVERYLEDNFEQVDPNLRYKTQSENI
jgi:hypothetical protein